MNLYEAQLRYRIKKRRPVMPMSGSALVANYMARVFFAHPMNEAMFVLCLNRKNHLLCHTLISMGTVNSTVAHPREIFRAAVLATACSIILSHNHPSGDPSPSPQDMLITRITREAARVVDIDLLDHVIVGDKEADPKGLGYFSFRDAGMV
jgi:DNA repair protein RadC